MIDLHGLFVGEALEYAELAFESAVLEDDKVVRFIVGTSSPRALTQVSNGSRRLGIQAKEHIQRMARQKFGRRWKNSVKSTFGISCSPFCILTLVGLRRGFTYYLDPKNAGVLNVHC